MLLEINYPFEYIMDLFVEDLMCDDFVFEKVQYRKIETSSLMKKKKISWYSCIVRTGVLSSLIFKIVFSSTYKAMVFAV